MSEEFHETLRKIVDEKLRFVHANREALLEAWIAKTGLSPDQACMVQQDLGGETRIWVEEQTDRCMTHRAEVENLRAENRKFREHIIKVETRSELVASSAPVMRFPKSRRTRSVLKAIVATLLLSACASPCEDCTGLRYMLDVSERRIEEVESQLGMCRVETRAAYKDLDEALEQLERADDDADEGRAYAKDLIHKLDIMETHDRQREDLRSWAGGPEVPEL